MEKSGGAANENGAKGKMKKNAGLVFNCCHPYAGCR